MKKNLIITAFLFIFCALSLSIYAQTPAPVDPSWRIGTLSNGMKYYIRQNPKVKPAFGLRTILALCTKPTTKMGWPTFLNTWPLTD